MQIETEINKYETIEHLKKYMVKMDSGEMSKEQLLSIVFAGMVAANLHKMNGVDIAKYAEKSASNFRRLGLMNEN